jgi:uncharacterized paraquat-inducible protein A
MARTAITGGIPEYQEPYPIDTQTGRRICTQCLFIDDKQEFIFCPRCRIGGHRKVLRNKTGIIWARGLFLYYGAYLGYDPEVLERYDNAVKLAGEYNV